MVEERMQRRLAAILVSDVVGYSGMMAVDENGTLTRLKALRAEVFDPVIERHGGRIFKNTGDGALVEFSSALNAVQAALDIQGDLSRRNALLDDEHHVLLRIGISLGDVIIDEDDLYGNGVNIAARMETLAEPGEICISTNVHEHVSLSVDAAIEDLGDQAVKGLDRPVRCYRLIPRSVAQSDPDTPAPLPLPDKPSIAVLPFQNMSGDPEQEFFADGMAEDIITGLSRYRSLFVIARNSTFAYKGQSPDLRDVSRDLGVRYVLEGSIRKGGSRIRLTAQLIEGTSGNHIWAERYDRELTDIFAVQDEITEAIVAAIGPEIDQVERERAQRLPPESLDAWESYQRGLWHLYRFNKEDNAEAQRLFKQTALISPNFAPAKSGLTHALYFSFMHGYAEDRSAVLDEAYESGRQAIVFDERDADAHFALGRILQMRHELDASIAECEAAVSYNPSYAHAHLGLGTALMFAGKWSPAIENLDRTIRLSPHDPLLWIVLTAKSMALLGLRQLEEAEETVRQATRQPTAELSPYAVLAAILGQSKKDAEAQQAMVDLLRIKPDVSISHIEQIFPFRDKENLAYLIEGLRIAGIPH